MAKIHQMPSLPLANIIIDASKGFVLQRIGTYSSQLEEVIIHTFVPFDNLCIVSPKTSICQYVAESQITNILELNTIMATHDVARSRAPYDSQHAASVIGKDLLRTLTIHRPDQIMREKNSIFHYINGSLHVMKNNQKSMLMTNPFDVNNNRSTIPRLSQKPSAIIQEQILDQRIGFEFLTNNELKYFLSTILLSIDKLNTISNLRESLAIFFQLVIAQTTYALRSCSIDVKDVEILPCIVVSTLFMRPFLDSASRYLVYRLIPLPIVVNGSKYIYSNLPLTVGFNTESQSLIIWENESDQKECMFTFVVQCRMEPLPIPLSSSSCLFELFSQETFTASTCHVSRTRDIHSGIMNIANGIWYFYDNNIPMYCQSRRSFGEASSAQSTNGPAIFSLFCYENITCTNGKLIPNTCTNLDIVAKAGDNESFQKLTSAPLLLKNLTKKIISIYLTAAREETIKILDEYNDINKIWKYILEEFSTPFLSAIVVILFALIVFIITCIRRILHLRERVDTVENDVFEIVELIIQNKDTD